jgi:mannose-6-phosphate isomerase-like protein (cupin superfamily)
MSDDVIFPAWRDLVRYSGPGPAPTILRDEPGLRVLVAGLDPAAGIPPHPGPQGVYHFLEGEGTMTVGDERHTVSAGMTVIAPAGATRGISATTRLAFLAVRVGAEDGG